MRRTVITGAGSGIGLATARRMLQAGDHVVAAVRTAGSKRLTEEALAGLGAAEVVVADVRSQDDVARLFQEPAGCVVASAGVCRQARLDDGDTDEVWSDTIDTNLYGIYYALKHGTQRMPSGGSVVVISSGLGKNARAGYEAYCASKHAVLGLTKCVALELAPRGIRVNAVCPGWVDTPMSRADCAESARRAGVPVEEVREAAVAGIPLGRMVTAEDVAGLVAWLTSGEASAITGQAYNISGGEFFN
ncbi:MAG: SDR family oxidoreductase [bacterium]